MFLAFWIAVTYRELMANRGRGYLNPNAEHSVISSDTLRRAVDGLAVPFEDLPAHLRIDTYSRSTLFDLTPFRARPRWIMPDGLVLCVDSPLLMERFGPHVFWSVMNALDTPERRRQFTGTWGLAFESYALDALHQLVRGKKWSYVRNPVDETTHEEIRDGFASRDAAAVVIECKGTFGGRAKHGGVYQLVRGISRVWFQRVARGPLARPDSVTDVFPVLIVDAGKALISERFTAGTQASLQRFRDAEYGRAVDVVAEWGAGSLAARNPEKSPFILRARHPWLPRSVGSKLIGRNGSRSVPSATCLSDNCRSDSGRSGLGAAIRKAVASCLSADGGRRHDLVHARSVFGRRVDMAATWDSTLG